MKKLLFFAILIVIFKSADAQFGKPKSTTIAKVENQAKDPVVQKTEPVTVVVPQKTQEQLSIEAQLDSLKKANAELQNQKDQLKKETDGLKIKIDTLTSAVNQEMAKNQGTSKKFNEVLAKRAAKDTANNKTIENVVPIIPVANDPVVIQNTLKNPVVQNAPVAKNPVVVKPTKGHPLLNAKTKTFDFVTSDKKDKDIAPTLEELEDLGWIGTEWPR